MPTPKDTISASLRFILLRSLYALCTRKDTALARKARSGRISRLVKAEALTSWLSRNEVPLTDVPPLRERSVGGLAVLQLAAVDFDVGALHDRDRAHVGHVLLLDSCRVFSLLRALELGGEE